MNTDDRTMTTQECTARARDILIKNDRTTFTVPTDALYPHQWNWDSAFVTLGWRTIDYARAWTELHTLFDAQWPNGMVPHIIYHHPSESYFPDAARWGATPHGNSSGLTQNPIAAFCVRQLLAHAPDRNAALQEIRRVLPKIAQWHRWLFEHRRHRVDHPDDPDSGLIAIAHPWESRDNACDWDEPLHSVNIDGVPPYARKDTHLVTNDQRPTGDAYDRFMAIIETGKAVGWELTAHNAPFWVADPFFMSILIAAEADLAALAEIVDELSIQQDARRRRAALVTAFERLWDTDACVYRSRDLLRGSAVKNIDIGTFLPLYAGIPDTTRAAQLLSHLERWLTRTHFGVPSHDPDSPTFESARYWRGPTWLVVNFLIAHGASRYDRDDLAEKIRSDSRALVQRSGFYEAFDPISGLGSGGNAFSWTAAMWLHWLADE